MTPLEHKIVVLGAMGSGKTTLVRSIADGAVVDTEVADSEGTCTGKHSTTVALDYADIALPNGDRLRLYGTPGQQRFSFVWPILLQGARGALVLVDARGPRPAAQLRYYLDTLREHAGALPAVVGVTHLDQASPACAARLGEGLAVPVLPLDARDCAQGAWLMDVLMGEIEALAWGGAHG